jgi:subtilisin-like proprotein convertase family protein
MNMKPILILVLACGMTTAAFGQDDYNTNLTMNIQIPDYTPSGLAQGIDISGLSGTISSVTLSVDIAGGYNGDLYAYLAGPNGGFAVLLNRVGISTASPNGYSDTGFDVTFSDTAASSINNYQSGGYTLNSDGQLPGTYQPSGENIDPQSAPSAFASAPQTAMLASFNGMDPNGEWVLFISDLSPGGVSTLQGVNLSIVTTVPEPQTWWMVGAGLAMFGLLHRRQRNW